jgi:hypothetical protein
VTNRSIRRSISALSGVSLIALAAAMPHAAYAQSSETGAPGQALTAGTITSATGGVNDNGAGWNVFVAAGDNDIVTVDNAVINSSNGGQGLVVTNYTGAPGQLDINFTGANDIASPASSVYVVTNGEDIFVDASEGSSTFTGNGGLQINSTDGAVTVVNGANTFAGGGTAINAYSANNDVNVDSHGGVITSGTYGIAAASTGGDVAVGQQGGVTTAISGVSDIGIAASTGGSGTVNVSTGAGGTVNGGLYGVSASTTGAGAVSVNIGDEIGAGAAPLTGVQASSQGGAVSVDATAHVIGVNQGVSAFTNGGTGSVSVSSAGVDGGVSAAVYGGTGAASVTLHGGNSINGAFGASAITDGSGNASVTGDAGSVFTATSGAAVTARSGSGTVNVNLGGTASGAVDGIYTRDGGSGATTIAAAGPISGGYRGVNALTTGTGAITIGTSGARLGAVTAGNGDGVYANGGGAISIYSTSVTATGGGGVSQAANGTAQGSFYGSGFGIDAVSTGGSVVVNAAGTVTGGAGGGILAQSAGAGSTTTVTTGAVTTQGGRGIEADGAGGLDTVNAGGLIHGASDGIYASNTGTGGVTINAASGVTGGTGSGIRVRDYGGGTLNVGSALQRVGTVSGGDVGIRAVGNGSINVYAGQVSGVTNGILVSGGQGDTVLAQVVVDANGPVSSVNFGRTGVQANNFGQFGNSSSTVNLTGAVSANGIGIDAETTNGDVTITTAAVTGANHNDAWSVGVIADGGGDSKVAVTTNGAVSAGSGIYANTAGNLARDTVTVVANNTVTGLAGAAITAKGHSGAVGVDAEFAVASTGGAGVFASGDGAVAVVTHGVTTTGGTAATVSGANPVTGVSAANGYGVAAISTGGNVNVTANGSTVGGLGGGIVAQSAGTGTVNVTTTGAVSTTGGRAIEADGQGGLVTVNAGDTVNSTAGGIYAQTTGVGGITINTAAAVNGGAFNGIRATATGGGAINLGSSGQRLGAVTSTGVTAITATGKGDVNVYATSASGGANGIAAQSINAGANGQVTVNTSGPVTGANGFGIIAHNGGVLAANTVTVTSTGAVTATGGTAVDAEASGGDVTVHTSGVVTANSGNGQFWDAIFAHGSGDSAVSVTTDAAVNGSYIGIDAATAGTLARDTVSVTTNGAVTSLHNAGISAVGVNGAVTVQAVGAVNSAQGDGVFASGAGQVSVTTNTVTTTGGTVPAQNAVGGVTGLNASNGYAIAAVSSNGPVTVDANGAISGGAAGGIAALSTGGGAVTVTSGAVTTAGGRGIEADSAGGLVTVNSGGLVFGATGGIYANNTGSGGININTTAAVLGQGSTGIRANTTGSGTINLGTAGQRLAAVTGGASGVVGTGGGDVNVHATTVTGATNAIVAQSIQPGANGAVTVDASGTLTGNSGYGVLALNNGVLAANTTTVTTTGAINSAGGAGIDAESTGGDVTVSSSGVITALGGNGTFWDGIYARGAGDSAITVTANAAVNGSYQGIDVATTGTLARDTVTVVTADTVTSQRGAAISAAGRNGLITVNAIGAVTAAGGDGVFATGAGAIDITTNLVTVTGGALPAQAPNGQVTGVTAFNGYAVAGISTAGPVDISTNATVSGGAAGGILAQSGGTGTVSVYTAAVSAAGGRGIEADGMGGLVTIVAGGPVASDGDAIYASNTGGDIAISAASGATSATGSGIRGRVYTSGTLNVGSALDRVGGVSGGDAGIRAISDGSLSVYATSVSGVTNGILTSGGQAAAVNAQVLVDATGPIVSTNAGRTGVQAYNFGQLGNSGVTVNLTGSVTANGIGVDAEASNGDLTVTTAAVTGGNNGDAWSTGVLVDGGGDSQIHVTTNGAVLGGAGVMVIGEGTLARDTVSVTTNGAVTGLAGAGVSVTGRNALVSTTTVGQVTSTGGAGVFSSGAGAVSVVTHGVSTTGGATANSVGGNPTTGVSAANGFGIAAVSTGGNVNVAANSLVSGGAAGGIVAQSAGAGTVTVNAAAVTATGGKAIEADAQSGAVNVSTTGLIGSAAGGIYAQNTGGGGITINTAAAVNGGAFNGIRATATGSGSINLGSSGQYLAAVTSTGITAITATGKGDVNVYATSASGGTNGIAAQSINAGANGQVTVNASGAITGASGFGIIAHNGGALAANTVSVTTGGAVTATGGTAVDAEANGGDVTVHSSGVVTANAGNGQYWDAIYAHGAGDSAVTVTTDAAVNGSYIGIDAASAGTQARDTVTVNANAAVSAGYPGVSAIQAVSSGQGSVVVNKAAGGALGAAGGVGITAQATASTGTANVTVTNAAQIGAAGAGQTVTGISASVAAGNAGAISIASNTGALYATGTGISAVNAGSGSVDIGATTGGISSAINTAGVGIAASSVSGNIAITTAAGGTISAGAAVGISAHTVSGGIIINQAGDIGAAGLGNTVGEGIHAVIDGGSSALTIHSTGRIYVTAGVGPASAGIYAVNSGTGAVVVTSTGTIDPGAYGAYIQGAGPVSYTASGGTVEGDTGVFIQSTGGGTVNLASTSGTTINGLNGAGVVADSGAGNTSIVTNGGVNGTTTGISATSTGAGSTTLTTNGAVTGGTGAGILINSGTGGLALSVNGNVTSTGAAAIDATSAAGGVINIGSGSHITGLVSSANTGVINLNTASGSSTIVNVSTGATVAAAAGSAFNIAVEAHGGSVTVNNGGTITGQVDFSHLTGANSGALVNAPGTVFITGGTSLFNAGDDNFANSGQIDTAGPLTTFDFLGGVNHVSNSGTIRVGFNPVAASSFRLVGVSQFANSGTLQMQNGVVGDAIVANGAAFTGTGASKLSIDANLGGPGSLADTLTVSSTAGSTKLFVHDTGAAFGAYNPGGVVVVNGTTHAGDFTFDPTSSAFNASLYGGVLDKPGMFFYDLAVNGAGAAVLVSAPKREAEQLTNLGAQAQTLWYTTAPNGEGFAARRDAFAAGAEQADRPLVWVNLTGAYAQRDHTQHYADFNKDYAYDTSYRQDLGGVTFGADSGWRGDQAEGGSWQFGLTAAYVTSDAKFDNSATRARMEGVALSAHASYVMNDIFVDLGYAGDILKAKVSAPDLAGLSGKPDITSNGGSVAVGIRKPFIGGSVIEPTLSLTYMRSSIGDLAAGGETIRYYDAQSLRAGMGFRVSGQFQGGDDWGMGYTLSARAVDELKGRNAVLFTGMGAPLTLVDRFDRGFGEVGAGLTFQGKGGWSGYANGSLMFNSDYSAPSISLGGRYRF